MKFHVGNINDLLKSMVVQDLGGGQVSTVSYGSKDPITKTLKSFAIDLTANPTLGATAQPGPRREGGDRRPEQDHRHDPRRRDPHASRSTRTKSFEVEVLNLLTDEGLRSVPLDHGQPHQARSTRSSTPSCARPWPCWPRSHATDKKTVTLNFLGEGKRQVRVGYIQETPIWKTSYRLVLDDEEGPLPARLGDRREHDRGGLERRQPDAGQRPADLVHHGSVPAAVRAAAHGSQLELYASLRPQTYEQDLAQRELELPQRTNRPLAAPASAPARRGDAGGGKGAALAEAAGRAEVRGRGTHASAAGQPADSRRHGAGGSIRRAASGPLATAGNVGELFQYDIATPVTLARQQSAMLPIVNAEVKGEKVSIYNPQVQAKHPLNGLKLTNSTDLHLMQGPITVFDGGAYAGDAKIEDLPPGSERLISYAMDLDTEVAPESKAEAGATAQRAAGQGER